MAFVKKDWESLKHFVPDNCFDAIFNYINQYAIYLKITQQRKSIHGNYTYNKLTKQNTITINGTLNPYAFLITLLHEIAHCVCTHTYGTGVAPHGDEWKLCYKNILLEFINLNIFPSDIHQALLKNINNQKASSCADPFLDKVLDNYNTHQEAKRYLEDIPIGEIFTIENGKQFVKIEKRRTRYLCKEISTNKMYLFPAVYKIPI